MFSGFHNKDSVNETHRSTLISLTNVKVFSVVFAVFVVQMCVAFFSYHKHAYRQNGFTI